MSVDSKNVENDRFPELEAFEREQQKRHRRVVVVLLAAGVPLFGIGAYIFVAMDPVFMFVALLMMAMGLFAVVRALLSLSTDFDLRDRADWVGVAAPEDIHYGPPKDDDL